MTIQGKVLVGFSLALACCLTIGCSFAFLLMRSFHVRPVWLAGGMGLLGLLLLALGRMRDEMPDSHQRKALSASPAPQRHPLGFLKQAGYWGCMLLVTSVPAYFLMRPLDKPLVVMARTLPDPEPARDMVALKPSSPPVVARSFPQLSLRGLICNGTHSTAAINEQTIRLGERIEGVRVVAIERWGVTVELDGREKHITLAR